MAVILQGLLIAAWLPAAARAETPASPSDESIRRTVQQVIAEEDIQHDPPNPVETPVVRHEPWNLEWMRYPLWILLGLGAIALLWQVAKTMMQLSRPGGSAPGELAVEAKTIQRDEAAAPDLLPELDEILALARAGAFEAAVHLLLLQGLGQISRATGINLPPALTSREILRRPGLPPGAGKDLATLVGAVEVSRFGGRPAGETIFQTCLDSYRHLIGAIRPASLQP